MRKIYIWAAVLLVSWSMFWVVARYYLHVDRYTERDVVLFWTLAKVMLWVLPALYLLKASKIAVGTAVNSKNWKQILLYGGAVGLLVALTGIIPRLLHHQPLISHVHNYSLLNVLVVAPVFEEFLCRGALLFSLQEHMTCFKANLFSATFFLLLHFPGWYFGGTFLNNLTKPIGGAFSILVLGLVFGWVSQRSKSFLAGAISHALNNFAS